MILYMIYRVYRNFFLNSKIGPKLKIIFFDKKLFWGKNFFFIFSSPGSGELLPWHGVRRRRRPLAVSGVVR
jgi:hypothetical protein